MIHTIDTTAFLYTRRRGHLEVIKGGVELARRPRWDKSRFYYTSDGKEKYINCANNASEMLNGTVWMVRRDDEQARKMFLDYERNIIDGLEDKLDKHNANFEALLTEKVKARN